MYIFKLGDAQEILPTFEDKSFDMVLTSPPFRDDDIEGEYWIFYDKIMRELFRITKKVMIIIHSSTKMNEVIKRYPPKRTVIWHKLETPYTHRYNPVFIYQISDEYKINKYIWTDSIGAIPVRNSIRKTHPYQDPLMLYVLLLKMFKGCDSVLDPFIGSGTTAKAAGQLGRDCTGIDLIDYRETTSHKT